MREIMKRWFRKRDIRPHVRCVTRFCLKGFHSFCSGTVTFGYLPSKPCACDCHSEEAAG